MLSSGGAQDVGNKQEEVVALQVDNMDLENNKPNEPQDEGIAKFRVCTDIFYVFLMAGFFVVLFGLLGYCMSYGDINRIINGYDDCGNVCGVKNERNVDIECSGVDHTQNGYLFIEMGNDYPDQVHRTCVKDCKSFDNYDAILNRCIKTKGEPTELEDGSYSKTGLSDFFQEVFEDLHTCWRDILYLSIIAFLLSVIILMMFRYMAAVTVWVVLFGVVVASVGGTCFLWVMFSQQDGTNPSPIEQRNTSAYLVYAIMATVQTFIVCCVIFVMRKRIPLVIELFEEAGKAVAAMPALLLKPILTFICLACVAALWLYFALWIESAGVVTIDGKQSAEIVKNGAMMFTRWYNLLALCWFTQFCFGCQDMVIAGAVATWFFTRNKSKLHRPVMTSFGNLIKYHLGTVAFGSLLISLIKLIRAMLRSLEYSSRRSRNPLVLIVAKCGLCWMSYFERFVEFITRNAYIMTAMHGHNFCTAGKKAFAILANNALRVLAINSVGDFVLWLSKILVVICTVLLGVELIHGKRGVHHNWIPLALAGLCAYFIAHCFLTVYEMTIDTIFLCFCEDSENNDGISRPYFMSRGLMEFVENSKKTLENHGSPSTKEWADLQKNQLNTGGGTQVV